MIIQVIQIRIRIYLGAVDNPKIINQGYLLDIYIINKTGHVGKDEGKERHEI
jgi:hypothetical protein